MGTVATATGYRSDDAQRRAKGRAAFRASRLSAGLGSVVDNETQNKCKKFLTIV